MQQLQKHSNQPSTVPIGVKRRLNDTYLIGQMLLYANIAWEKLSESQQSDQRAQNGLLLLLSSQHDKTDFTKTTIAKARNKLDKILSEFCW
jgi:hypothetical protein